WPEGPKSLGLLVASAMAARPTVMFILPPLRRVCSFLRTLRCKRHTPEEVISADRQCFFARVGNAHRRRSVAGRRRTRSFGKRPRGSGQNPCAKTACDKTSADAYVAATKGIWILHGRAHQRANLSCREVIGRHLADH